jgi:serine/threonine-protein kinase
LKAILLSDAARSTNVERFQVEAGILARIDHVNLGGFLGAGRHESDEHGTILYMVLEYLEGQTLRALLTERGPVGCQEALRWAIQIADALSAIHEMQVIHRDLKPENVMIVSGIAKVIDLGIAKARNWGAKTTEKHLKVGTMSHMAPEQFESGERVAEWTDVYALGLLLFELIAGRHALIRPEEQGALGTPEFVARALLGEPAVLSEVASDVPAEVDAIIARALAKKPEERFQTALEMRNAMKRCVHAATHLVSRW